MSNSLKCWLTKGWTEIIFLVWAFTVLMISPLLEGLFGPSKVLRITTNTAPQVPIVGLIRGQAVVPPEAIVSPISSNYLLYTSDVSPFGSYHATMLLASLI